eukprot:445121-Hanusia_phi.AAC.1
MEGRATSAKGTLQPNWGPTTPLTNCPMLMPKPWERETMAETTLRLSLSNISPNIEKMRGRAPPTAMPVRARRNRSSW